MIGGTITLLPLYLVWKEPGHTATRHVIAASQMIFAALFIHLCGGRIETHFHVFGSLALLAFYRDWRVLLTASLVITLDHGLRGLFFPQSVYGIYVPSLWRTAEHVFWVVVEDIFLIRSCLEQVYEMQAIACRQAELEATRNNIEALVTDRTAQLRRSEKRLATQNQVSNLLAEADSLARCATKVLAEISAGIMCEIGTVWSAVWTVDRAAGLLNLTASWNDPSVDCQPFKQAYENTAFEKGIGLPGKVWDSGRFQMIRTAESDHIRCYNTATACGLQTGFFLFHSLT